MNRLHGLLITGILLTGSAHAQHLRTYSLETVPPRDHGKYIWIASLAAMSAGSAADAFVSWHRLEANPMLATQGRFGGKGVTIKAGVLAGLVMMEIRARHNPQARKAAIVANWASAGMFGAMSWRDR